MVCLGCHSKITDDCFYSLLREEYREEILVTVYDLLLAKYDGKGVTDAKIIMWSDIVTEKALDALGRMMFHNEECHTCTFNGCLQTDFYAALVNDFLFID